MVIDFFLQTMSIRLIKSFKNSGAQEKFQLSEVKNSK